MAWTDRRDPDREAGMALVVAALIWILLVFNVVPEGFDYSAVAGGMPAQGSWTSRFVWLALLATGAIVLILRNGTAQALLRWFNPFLLLIVPLACVSIIWSIDPNLTLRRLVRLAAVLVCAYAFALPGWHPRRFQNVVRPVLTVMIVASLALGILAPDIAITESAQAELAGAWRGIATQKNGLGALASLGAVFWFHALLARDVRPLLAGAGLATCVACLVLSRSATSMLATGVVAAYVLAAVRAQGRVRRSAPQLAVIFAAIVVIYTLALLHVVPGLGILLDPIATLTGKGLTFTGRTDLWQIIRERIAMRPMLGSGFGAYWAGPVPWSQSYEFVTRLNFYPTQAHNGYLDVMNDLGAVGLFCLLGYLGAYMLQSLRLMALDGTQGTLYLALLFQQLVVNLAESRWWNVLSVDFCIMTLATAALARDYVEARLRLVATQK